MPIIIHLWLVELQQQIPWSLVVTASSFLIGGAFGIILILMRFPAARFLGRLLLSYCLLFVPLVLETSFPFHSVSIAIVSVSLYIYAIGFFSQKTRVSYLHLIPILFFVSASLLDPSWSYLIAVLIVLVYLTFLFRLLRQEGNTRGISWFLNPGERIAWFRNFIAINLLAMIYLLIDQENQLVVSGIFMLVTLTVVYQVFKESHFLTPIPVGNKYKKSTLTPQIKSSILSKIERVMDEQEFYLRDDASLTRLAEALGATTHHLSQVLNESLKISFQDLIARYRIRRACQILRDEAYAEVKIENVAAMVGYNSKSAFNTTFKRKTGLTPSAYRDARDVLTYGEEHLSERKEPSNEHRWIDLNHGFTLKIKSDMIRHFLKVFSRNVKRNSLFSFLNVFGLTVGFTSSILIYLFIQDELAYDKSLPDSESVYRIAWISENPQTRTPHPMAQAMVADLPEVIEAVSLSPWYGPGLSKELVRVKNVSQDILFEEPNFYFADSTFFDVFPLDFVEGDEEALSKPWTLVISESMAKKYFGDSSAIGKELELNDMPIAVTAVVKDMPKHSHFHFNAILPYVTIKYINPSDGWMTWADFGHFNYIKLREGTDPLELEAKIPTWVSGYLGWSEESIAQLIDGEWKFALQPISSIHLHSHLRWELENNGNILYIYILSGTLAFLLLIAAINYINLTTAKSIERAKEVGVRKTLGAVSGNLSIQFYLESVFFSAVAMLISICLAYLLLDSFNFLSGKSFESSLLISASFLSKAFLFCIVIGLLAGIYPAVALSSFRPTEVLKGKLTTSSKGVRLRSALVVLQFCISAILISGSLIINRQIFFMKDKDLGFDQEAVVSLSVPISVELGSIDLAKVRTVQQGIESIKGVLNTSLISNLPGGQFNQHAYYLQSNPENRVDASEVMVDFDFEDVLGMEIVQGRSYDPTFPTDTVRSFIINEVARQQLNIENPIGEKLVWVGNDEELEGTIIGVVKDFHYRSLHEDIQPLVMTAQPYGAGHILVKVAGKDFSRIMEEVRPIYEELSSELPFGFQFLDQELASLYRQEERTLSIFSTFSGIALILASLGLLGMAIAILNQRVKEVGLRKILGASSSQIMSMILGQFARLIVIAMIIGLPISYLVMQSWMNEFSYQAPFGIMPFIWAAIVLLVVAMVSVISAVTKITYSNPVDALKYE